MFMKRVVLMYHDIGKDSGFQNDTAQKYKVGIEEFEKHVKAIRDYLNQNNLDSESVAFTFDDGGISFYTNAAPILEKYEFKGVFFIATEYIGTEGFLSENQIKELEGKGHTIGSHSHTHPERMDIMSESDLHSEWSKSTRILKEILRHEIKTASIPNGYSSKKVTDVMHACGIHDIYTSSPTTKKEKFKGSNIIGRYDISSSETAEYVVSLISSSSLRFKKKIRHDILGVAKFVLGDTYLKIRQKLLR